MPRTPSTALALTKSPLPVQADPCFDMQAAERQLAEWEDRTEREFSPDDYDAFPDVRPLDLAAAETLAVPVAEAVGLLWAAVGNRLQAIDPADAAGVSALISHAGPAAVTAAVATVAAKSSCAVDTGGPANENVAHALARLAEARHVQGFPLTRPNNGSATADGWRAMMAMRKAVGERDPTASGSFGIWMAGLQLWWGWGGHGWPTDRLFLAMVDAFRGRRVRAPAVARPHWPTHSSLRAAAEQFDADAFAAWIWPGLAGLNTDRLLVEVRAEFRAARDQAEATTNGAGPIQAVQVNNDIRSTVNVVIGGTPARTVEPSPTADLVHVPDPSPAETASPLALSPASALPEWNGTGGDLCFRGRRKHYKGAAETQREVLNLFHTKGWPVSASLPHAMLKKQRLSDIVRGLNKATLQSVGMRWHGDGDGAAIRWEPART